MYPFTYTPYTYDYSKIGNSKQVSWPVGKRRKHNAGWHYRNLVCSFDIETSKIQYRSFWNHGKERKLYQSFMYVWMCAIEKDVVVGRTWDDYKIFIEKLIEQINGDRLIIFVHNLSYEFQFLSGVMNFEQKDVFALERRKVAKATYRDSIEYRCSYIHSNMSLAEWASKMKVQHQKLAGDLDYSIVRYPWTPIFDEEWEYNINDVLSVVECIHADMEVENDTLATIPLTNTGYIRRDVKNAMKSFPRDWLKTIQPNIDLYRILRQSFRGGDTHANRYYTGKIISNVKGVDRVSSYPDVMMNELYPMSKFIRSRNPSMAELVELLSKHKAVVFTIRLFNVRLRDQFEGFPYIPVDKCRALMTEIIKDEHGKKKKKYFYENDNGRILKATVLEMSMTDIDFKVVYDQYKWDGEEVLDIWYANYAQLPQQMRDVIEHYFRQKTELKGVEGAEVLYMKSKNKINSAYGMTAQNPVKPSIIYDHGKWKVDTSKSDEELLDIYTAHPFLPYQIGVWTTAHARYQLHLMRKIAGKEHVLYCDTDSVKYIGEADYTEYNRKRERISAKNGAIAEDRKGNLQIMGIAETDSYYNRFITFGAKKYAYEDSKNHLHITVAGVSKEKGAYELALAGGLEKFDIGFTWEYGGGTESVYNDIPEVDHFDIFGRRLEVTSNVVIMESEYTLGITDTYSDIINNARYVLEEINRTI